MDAATNIFSARVGKELAWVIAGQVMAAAGGFIGVRYMTRAMAPAVYGELALALTGATLVQQCVGGPISQSAIRFFALARETARLPEYFASIRRMVVRASGFLVVFGFAGYMVARSLDRTLRPLPILLGLLFSIVYGCNIVTDAIQSGARRRIVVAFHQALAQWLKPLLAVAVMLLLGASAWVALFGYVAAVATVLISQIASLRPHIRAARELAIGDPPPAIAPEPLNSLMTRYAWPFVSWGLLCWLQVSSDRWFLNWFRDPESVAAFAVCFQLGYYPILLLSTAIGSLTTPILFQVGGDGQNRERLQRAAVMNYWQTLVVLSITALAALAVYPLRFPLMRTLAAPVYASCAVYLPWMILAGGLFSAGQAASMIFLVGTRPDRLVRIKIITAVLGTLSNGILIYYMGIAGAVVSCLGFGFIYCLSVIVCIRGVPEYCGRRPVAPAAPMAGV